MCLTYFSLLAYSCCAAIVQQALRYDPHNAQLLRTQELWSSPGTIFTDYAQRPLAEILHSLPQQQTSADLVRERQLSGVCRLQARCKGVRERTGARERTRALLGCRGLLLPLSQQQVAPDG